jgi:hypothetical protein
MAGVRSVSEAMLSPIRAWSASIEVAMPHITPTVKHEKRHMYLGSVEAQIANRAAESGLWSAHLREFYQSVATRKLACSFFLNLNLRPLAGRQKGRLTSLLRSMQLTLRTSSPACGKIPHIATRVPRKRHYLKYQLTRHIIIQPLPHSY